MVAGKEEIILAMNSDALSLSIVPRTGIILDFIMDNDTFAFVTNWFRARSS